MPDPEVIFEFTCGACPVQAEGAVDGVPFYFRSRGSAWSMNIGIPDEGDPESIYLDGKWEYSEPYGKWPDAGWITLEQATEFIMKAARLWRDRPDQP